jgi:Xaa-Pro dipeptidase
MFIALTNGANFYGGYDVIDRTIGVGGSDPVTELSRMRPMVDGLQPILKEEYLQRLQFLRSELRAQGIDCLYVDAGTNLNYFTGVNWYPTERKVGALVYADGGLDYIVPAFEKGTFMGMMHIDGEIHCWHEDECSYELFSNMVLEKQSKNWTLALDDTTPLFRVEGIRNAVSVTDIVSGGKAINACRRCKSDNEIALMQRANTITLSVHKAAARILRPGITPAEVVEFINKAHQAMGAKGGSDFCIVLFGEDTQYPHGVLTPKALEENDNVLIDTGCNLMGYHSDITRCYVFGTPSDHQREVWNQEKALQAVAFSALEMGKPCGVADKVVRLELGKMGYGPDYELPGVPHRVGHGIGLDIHESPNLVRNDETPLQKGMCFSVEPMLCIPGEFGVRLEDLIYISEDGPRWFTQPCHSIDNPFAYEI